jgi:hypothetical protein
MIQKKITKLPVNKIPKKGVKKNLRKIYFKTKNSVVYSLMHYNKRKHYKHRYWFWRNHIDKVIPHSKLNNVMTAGLYNYKIAKKTHQDKLGLGVNLVYHILIEMYTVFELWEIVDEAYAFEYLANNNLKNPQQLLYILKRKGMSKNYNYLSNIYDKMLKYKFPKGRYNRRTRKKWRLYQNQWRDARMAMFTYTFFYCITKIIQKVIYLKKMYSQMENTNYYIPGKIRSSLFDFFKYVEKKYVGVCKYWHRRKKLKYYAYLNMYKNNWQAVMWEYKELLSKSHKAIQKLFLTKTHRLYALLTKISIQNMFNIVYDINLAEVMWIYDRFRVRNNIISIGDMANVLNYRIDNIISSIYNVPRVRAHFLVSEGYVLINNDPCTDINTFVTIGDWIELRNNKKSIENSAVLYSDISFFMLDTMIRMLRVGRSDRKSLHRIKHNANVYMIKKLYIQLFYHMLHSKISRTHTSFFNSTIPYKYNIKNFFLSLYFLRNKGTYDLFNNNHIFSFEYGINLLNKTSEIENLLNEYVSNNKACRLYSSLAKERIFPVLKKKKWDTLHVKYMDYSLYKGAFNKKSNITLRLLIFDLLCNDYVYSEILNVSRILKTYLFKIKLLLKSYYCIQSTINLKLNTTMRMDEQKNKWISFVKKLTVPIYKFTYALNASKLNVDRHSLQKNLNQFEVVCRTNKKMSFARKIRIWRTVKKYLRICKYSKWKHIRYKKLRKNFFFFLRWCLKKNIRIPAQIWRNLKFLRNRNFKFFKNIKNKVFFNRFTLKNTLLRFVKLNLLKKSVIELSKTGNIRSNELFFLWNFFIQCNIFHSNKKNRNIIKDMFARIVFSNTKHKIPLDIKKYIYYINNRNVLVNRASIRNIDNNITLIYKDTTKGIEHSILISNVANFFAPMNTQYIWNYGMDIVHSLSSDTYYTKKYDIARYRDKVQVPDL